MQVYGLFCVASSPVTEYSTRLEPFQYKEFDWYSWGFWKAYDCECLSVFTGIQEESQELEPENVGGA